MPEPIIRIENVSRTFHVGDVDVHALRDVSLAVQPGEFLAIMGSSGSGKSTLMAILGCLDRPTGGRYVLEGEDVAGMAEPDLARIRSKRLGFVFQSFNLLPRTSAIENVALPLFYAPEGPVHPAARATRAREALSLLGLAERERSTPGQLSGGQQQRVAIARALINAPALLLADEPTGNLDTRTSHEIMQTLAALNREHGMTIVVVTHESDIAAYADRVITMRDGQIVADRKAEPRPLPPSPAAVAEGTSAGWQTFARNDAGRGAEPAGHAGGMPRRAGGEINGPPEYAVHASVSWPAKAGHPRLLPVASRKDVDGRAKPGHDTGTASTRFRAFVSPQALRAALAFGMMIGAAAMQALNRNRMRSALTMLGVFIGVAALIAMVAVGQGANQAVRKQIESLGTNLLVVLPGATSTGGARAGFGSASTITLRDAQAIRAEASAVSAVGYLIRGLGQVQYGGQNWTTSIQGISPNYPPMTNWQVESGRFITRDDDARSTLVVLIGQTVFRQLFAPGENPVGAVIQVKGAPLRVVGLLAGKGQTPFGTDQDDIVMIPFSTAERRVLGVASPLQAQAPLNWAYPIWPNPYGLQMRLAGYVNQLFVQAASPDTVATAMRQVTDTLSRRHRMQPDGVQDFSVRNLSQIAAAAEGSSRIMALLLAAVASISLLVGGIGIMNILLVSVTERTREIGLRMAIGARRLHVLLQFLAEAVFLSVTGGIAGIALGLGFSWTVTLLAGWPAPVSPLAIAGGFAFSAAVGIFFGYYPARKAARLDPIEALRYE